MKVFRMVDAEGNGVFQGAVQNARNAVAQQRGFRNWWDMDEAGNQEPDPYRHPGPSDEHGDLRTLEDKGLLYHGSPWYFGFKSEDQLLRWFDSEAIRKAMAEDGCKVRVYEAHEAHVAAGSWQVVFQIDEAKLVEERPVPTLA